MAIFFIWQWLNGGITPEEAYVETKAAVLPSSPRSSRAAVGEAPTVPQERALPRVTRKKTGKGHRGDIVLIIDDLGFDGQPLERLMALDPNVNVAILPNGTRASEFATRLHERGFEVLCHLPMQPRGKETPGRNAILTSMSDEEIARATRENIEAVPHARGVNNHMGSLATSDRRVMTSVIGAMPDGMYFIDSRTGGGSVASDVARELNVRTAARHVFLDDAPNERAVRRQLQELADAAEKRGVAIGIGHPYPVTMRVLADELPGLRARGFRFVRASEIVR
ncbi:MAG TPA: divergent polysaccharide deacetylase family protein [Thermoanaerobaculia bacterium]|nr:divergent polysaccharide deacetylase family protein [Thermoanaerobaculia bacterium]